MKIIFQHTLIDSIIKAYHASIMPIPGVVSLFFLFFFFFLLVTRLNGVIHQHQNTDAPIAYIF